MIKCIEFPDREFATKEAMFAALKESEEKIIGLKKAQVYKGADKAQFSYLNLDVSKVHVTGKASFDVKSDYIYPVISTTRYMDSHKDVHFDGCFAKTCIDQQGKVMYALDHELKYDSVLAWQKDVQMFVAPIEWSLVGKSYPGQTEGLVFGIPKAKINRPDVLAAIEGKSAEFENSIRMVYERMKLAINSDSKDMAENKAYYDSRINSIANKEQAMEDGYFWGVEELRIYKEGSLVVAGGSNDATRIIVESKNEPVKTTHDIFELLAPPDGTHAKCESIFDYLT